MSLLLSPCVFILSLVVPSVLGYGGGAPPTKCGVSGDMKPDHGLPIQTAPLPYTLTISTPQTTYSPGAVLTCKISFVYKTNLGTDRNSLNTFQSYTTT